MKRTWFFVSVLLIVLSLLLCTSCGKKSMEDQLVGSWYVNGKTSITRDGTRGPIFTLYDDGTCKIASEYGTGTWSVVNENQVKLTNFYGESQTATIASIEDGKFTLDDGTVYLSEPTE